MLFKAELPPLLMH